MVKRWAHIQTMSDQQLIWMVYAGDPHSLEELYDRYFRQCFSLAYRMLGVDKSAEIEVHNVFLDLWNSPATIADREDRKDIMGWLLKETHSRSLAKLNSQSDIAKLGVVRPADQATLPSRSPALTRELEGLPVGIPLHASAQNVQFTLQQLPEQHRQAIELAYFEGLSQQQIAARLGQSQEAVASYLRDGLRKIGL